MLRAAVLASGLFLSIGGCQPELGECNMAEANRIAISETGFAYYEGQAMINRDCSDGICHADVSGALRNGVPAGLNYDLPVACTLGADGSCLESDPNYEDLRVNGSRVFDHARRILEEVQAGTMPPRENADPDDYYRFGSRTTFDLATRTGDTPLPSIDSEEGQDILRNWLACTAPVIGANAVAADIADVGTSCRGMADVGECVVGAVIEPPEPNWDSIYDFFSGGNCVSGCHDGSSESAAMTFNQSMLDFSDQATAYEELLGADRTGGVSEGEACGGARRLVIPMDPTNSLLLQKITDVVPTGTELCGDVMPASGLWSPEYTNPIEEWIMAGAPEM